MHPDSAALLLPRWHGERGRLDVWYATITDPATGTGLWLHHELVAPRRADPYIHGWLAIFPRDGSPRLHRYGPQSATPLMSAAFFAGEEWIGEASALGWRLHFRDASAPVFTMPSGAWSRLVLPGVQAVPLPAADVDGWIDVGGQRLQLAGARGAVARICSRGHPHRWAWLHADLGGGDVCEVVAGVPHRPCLRWVPPATFVQLRLAGDDWPRRPLLHTVSFRTRCRADGWTTVGQVRGRRLRINVRLPAGCFLDVTYVDVDGSTATCRNSERAETTIVVERRRRAGWSTEAQWVLSGTAHAEIGRRP